MTNTNTPATISKPIAYAYTRFSSAQQADGDSKRRQDSLTSSWPDAPLYEIRNLHDAGISAYTGKNQTIGQFGQFLTALRHGKLGAKPVLLVENLDRISREELETAQTLFLEIISHGATIITLHNGKRYAKGMGLVDIITALVEMDLAHQHSAKLSMRVKAAWEARKRSGEIIHNRSQSPSWLRLNVERTQFEPIPERVAVVRRMFEMAARGLGPDAIAKAFNLEGLPSWSRRKSGINAWRGTTIAKVLYRRSVLGEFDGRAGYFGAGVIDAALWGKINSRIRRKAQGRGKGIISESNLLRGFVVSGIDGSKMILRKSGVKCRKTQKYVWHSYLVSNETISGRGSHCARYDLLENRLLWLLGILDPQVLTGEQPRAQQDAQSRLLTILKKIEIITSELSSCPHLYENGVISGSSAESPTIATRGALARMLAQRMETIFPSSDAYASAEVAPTPVDLGHAENRSLVRAKIAQWCRHIELRKNEFIIWFTELGGLRINLHGAPYAKLHVVTRSFSSSLF